MSIRFLFLFLIYLGYALSSGGLSTQGNGVPTKQGSGWDPSGLTSAPPPPVHTDQGSGWDPNG
jgi:hypothetical protein